MRLSGLLQVTLDNLRPDRVDPALSQVESKGDVQNPAKPVPWSAGYWEQVPDHCRMVKTSPYV